MKTLEKHLKKQKKIFIPYIMAGDHVKGLDGLAETIELLANAGASAIEIGVPFSDPVADGPVIEQAGLRALAKNVTLTALLNTLKTIKSPVPLIIMTYMNPVYQYGVEKFLSVLTETAVKGLIVPDVPLEAQYFITDHLTKAQDICLIQLVSLTTGIERQKMLVKNAEGFVYAVAINGVTGNEQDYSETLDEHLRQLSALTEVPVCVGFGVSHPSDVTRFNKVASGVIVGSKIVRDLYEKKDAAVVEFIQSSTK
ncbi:tryptophan synthase subunit alpha [Lactococcus hircilactis]|uniref:Tryptophan synthase alpha chain n=1 Tax=Lactococcus hircilactis TaxID=1494462 RepID=A0A7X1Z8S8_9LACT|nr:tryptophan synthase subunit alpha [Lactococcus hircilactis]MQW38852.1 tryptophan synthase subunit alpha [Lactococcus hircilactis]